MKVVHINWSDTEGGAAIAATRMCEAMRRTGIDATMLTLKKNGRKSFVHKLHLGWKSIFSVLNDVALAKDIKRVQSVGTFSLMKRGYDFTKDSAVQAADVIFIHWVNNNTLSLKGVEQILKTGKPVFWYMHDMFPITGGCHHSLGCDSYQKQCANCPVIKVDGLKQIATKQLKKKLAAWGGFSNLEFVTPSKWLGGCVKSSTLAQGHSVYVVPNVIDTAVFHPVETSLKSLLGLDATKKTIMFSAATYSSVYKGAKYMHDFLKELDPQRYEALAIGELSEDFSKDLDIKIVSTGYLIDDLSMVVAYNCADAFVISSVAENYPNVLLEAMACGIPCVGFPIGGIPDLIIHKETGYLTREVDAKELQEGVEFLFADEQRYSMLSDEARRRVEKYNAYTNVFTIHREINWKQYSI